jgi:hypothetical protein
MNNIQHEFFSVQCNITHALVRQVKGTEVTLLPVFPSDLDLDPLLVFCPLTNVYSLTAI